MFIEEDFVKRIDPNGVAYRAWVGPSRASGTDQLSGLLCWHCKCHFAYKTHLHNQISIKTLK
jgi:hypothetical protein